MAALWAVYSQQTRVAPSTPCRDTTLCITGLHFRQARLDLSIYLRRLIYLATRSYMYSTNTKAWSARGCMGHAYTATMLRPETRRPTIPTIAAPTAPAGWLEKILLAPLQKSLPKSQSDSAAMHSVEVGRVDVCYRNVVFGGARYADCFLCTHVACEACDNRVVLSCVAVCGVQLCSVGTCA